MPLNCAQALTFMWHVCLYLADCVPIFKQGGAYFEIMITLCTVTGRCDPNKYMYYTDISSFCCLVMFTHMHYNVYLCICHDSLWPWDSVVTLTMFLELLSKGHMIWFSEMRPGCLVCMTVLWRLGCSSSRRAHSHLCLLVCLQGACPPVLTTVYDGSCACVWHFAHHRFLLVHIQTLSLAYYVFLGLSVLFVGVVGGMWFQIRLCV